MDWDLAIKRNSKALKGIIEVLFALLGLDGTDASLQFALPPLARCWVCCGPPNPPCGLIVMAAECCGGAATFVPMAEGRKDGKREAHCLLPLFDPLETFEARAGHEIHPACPAHPFLRA